MGYNSGYLLVLVYLDKDWLDIAGNKYPYKGFIQAKIFTNDIDIRFGLYGILWGKTQLFIYEQIHKGHWAVVKIEQNYDLLEVDPHTNRYKFKEGIVLHSGNLSSCAEYILRLRDDTKSNAGYKEDLYWLSEEDVIGTKEWLEDHSLTV